MLSLVNYGSSDSENEITDEEEEHPTVNSKQNGKNLQDEANFDEIVSTNKIKLPEATRKTFQVIEEDDDEFLHKKEVPEVRPPPPPAPKVKQKVKIMIPKLSDFKDDENDEEFSYKKIPTGPKKTGLLGMLPKPGHSHSIGPAPKPQPSKTPATSTSTNAKEAPQVIPSPSTSTSNDLQQPKKIGLIPYALMDHKKTSDSKKELAKKKSDEIDSDDEEGESLSFFTFSSKDDDLPQVNESEIKLLIEKEAKRLEQRKRQNEGLEELDSDLQQQQQDYAQYIQQPIDVDKEAISALVGGNKAKRSKFEDIKIVDLSANDVLPDREEWIRKTLAGETGYIPTGQIDEKVSEFFIFFFIF